jgi:uncharacterized beta-barrel protein YwiB (DUF1934 family)
MTINAEIRIHSIIQSLDSGAPSGDPYVSTEVTRGTLTVEDGRISLCYELKSESGVTKYRLTLKEKEARLASRGATEATLSFKDGLRYSTVYSVPPYSFDASVESYAVTSTLTELGGDVRLHYKMNLGGDDREAKILIRVRTEGA